MVKLLLFAGLTWMVGLRKQNGGVGEAWYQGRHQPGLAWSELSELLAAWAACLVQ